VTIAFDAVSTIEGGSTPTYSFSHTPVGTPKGVLVFITSINATDYITSVTYGGVAMTEVSLSPLIYTGAEPGIVHAFFLGSSVPTGTQTVEVTTTVAFAHRYGVYTITAGGDTAVNTSFAISGDGANPSSTLSLSGVASFCALGFSSGRNTVGTDTTALTNWTEDVEVDGGTRGTGIYHYTVIGTADVTAGFLQSSDDYAILAVAIKEAGGGATTYTHTASLSTAIQQAHTATSSLSAAIQTNRTAIASVDMAIQQAFSASAALDAAIQRASTATVSLDTYIVAAGSYTATSSLSAAIQQARSATSSLDAAIANALSASAGVDAAISAGHTSSASLDTYVQVSGSGVVTANLGAAIQQAQLAIATLDIAIRVARNASANLDLVVATQGTTTSLIDLCISSNNTTTAGLDLLVLGSTQAYSSLNLYVYDGGALTLSETDLDAIADRVWTKVLESTFSSSDILKIILAAVSGKSTGVGTSNEVYLSVDELTERINVTFDTNNNRDVVNRDGT